MKIKLTALVHLAHLLVWFVCVNLIINKQIIEKNKTIMLNYVSDATTLKPPMGSTETPNPLSPNPTRAPELKTTQVPVPEPKRE